MAYTSKNELYDEVERLNRKYCSKTKNKLQISRAYGGYKVELTGKTSKRGLGDCVSSVTNGFLSPRETLNSLYKNESLGYLQNDLRRFEKHKRM